MVNRELPHVLILPEDDANRQLANGFWLKIALERQRQLYVERSVGGWNKVLDTFNDAHVAAMDRTPNRFMILLVDFDGRDDRLGQIRARIPQRLAERVFILGALTDPEALRHDLGSYEQIGSKLAQDCRENKNETWGHDLLRHNAGELARLRQQIVPILFNPV